MEGDDDDGEDEESGRQGGGKDEEEDDGGVDVLKETLLPGGRWGDWLGLAGAGSGRSGLCGAGRGRPGAGGSPAGGFGSSVARRLWRCSSLAPFRQLRADVRSWAKGFMVILSFFSFT